MIGSDTPRSHIAGSILALLLLGAGPKAWAGNLFEDQTYWYLDIHSNFFTPQRDDGGLRLIPSRRASRAAAFSKDKAPGSVRVFVLGGSVAWQYDNNPEYTDGWTLQRVLGKLLPGRSIEVINCGMGAYDSYRELLVLREVLHYDPDLIVLLSGNNDAMLQAGRPGLAATASVWLGNHLGFWRRLTSRARKAPARPDSRSGYLEEFEANLRAMIRESAAKSVPLVACALPRQIGVPPPLSLPLGRRGFFDAWVSWEKGDIISAERAFRRYLRQEPDDVLGRHYLGRCLERREAFRAATEEYRRSQAVLMQSYLRMNQVIRRVVQEEGALKGSPSGAVLCDLEKAFSDASPRGRNDHLLYDSVHWFRHVDPLVSVSIARSLAEQREALPRAWTSSRLMDPAWLDHEGRRVASLKFAWARDKTDSSSINWLSSGFWSAAAGGLRFSEMSLAAFERLYRQDPESLAHLDLWSSRLSSGTASNPWIPGDARQFEEKWPRALAHAAEALRRAGRHRDAVRLFDMALARDPSISIARLQRFLALRSTGDDARAREAWPSLAILEVEFPEARYYLELFGLRPRSAPVEAEDYGIPPLFGTPQEPGSDDGASNEARLERSQLRDAMAFFIREDWRAGFAATDSLLRRSGRERVKRQCMSQVNCAPWRRGMARLVGLINEGFLELSRGRREKAAALLDQAEALDPAGLGADMAKALRASGSPGDLLSRIRSRCGGVGVDCAPLERSAGNVRTLD